MNEEIRDFFRARLSCKSLRRSETSVPDLGLRRAEEGSVDFGAFGTRSRPGDRKKSQEITGDCGEIARDHRRSQEVITSSGVLRVCLAEISSIFRFHSTLPFHKF